MTLTEADTRSKLIDPAIHARGWTQDLIRREETAGDYRDYQWQGAQAGQGARPASKRSALAYLSTFAPVAALTEKFDISGCIASAP